MHVTRTRALLLSGIAVAALGIGALSAEGTRNYDSAVVCKAFSLLSKASSDERSKAAIGAIEAEIERDSKESGRTTEQAAADVEYSRYDWADSSSDQAFFEAEWTKCVEIWS
jgi:hypothetical protein